MTHRNESRNSASTRAIPLAQQLQNLLVNPFIPEKFGVNQPGMQAYNHLAGLKYDQAVEIWLQGRDRAVTTVIELILGRDTAEHLLRYESNREYVSGAILLENFDALKAILPKSTDTIDLSETSMLNVHKQLAGRGLEAYMWHTIIVSATEWTNYFALRDHSEAQGEIATIARHIRAAFDASEPRLLESGQWHLPLVDDGEFETDFDAIRASGARCAAVSYNRQGLKNPEKEFERYGQLRSGGHMSPLEHQATPLSDGELSTRRLMGSVAKELGTEIGLSPLVIEQLVTSTKFCGNFRGWRQHRKDILNEDDFAKVTGA